MEEKKDFLIWYFNVDKIDPQSLNTYLHKNYNELVNSNLGWQHVVVPIKNKNSYVQIVRVNPLDEIPDMENIMTLKTIKEILTKLS